MAINKIKLKSKNPNLTQSKFCWISGESKNEIIASISIVIKFMLKFQKCGGFENLIFLKGLADDL